MGFFREDNQAGLTMAEIALQDINGLGKELGQRQSLDVLAEDGGKFADVLIDASKIEFLRSSQGLMRILGKGAFGQVSY